MITYGFAIKDYKNKNKCTLKGFKNLKPDTSRYKLNKTRVVKTIPIDLD